MTAAIFINLPAPLTAMASVRRRRCLSELCSSRRWSKSSTPAGGWGLARPLHKEPGSGSCWKSRLRCALSDGRFPAIHRQRSDGNQSFNWSFQWARACTTTGPGIRSLPFGRIPSISSEARSCYHSCAASPAREKGGLVRMIDYGPHGGDRANPDKLNIVAVRQSAGMTPLDPGRLTYSHRYKNLVQTDRRQTR